MKTHSLKELFNGTDIQAFRNTIIDQSFRNCKSFCGIVPVQVDQFPAETQDLNLLPKFIMLALDQNCNLKCGSCRTKNIYSPQVDSDAALILDRLNGMYQNYNGTVFIRGDGAGDIFSSAAWRNFLMSPNLAKCFRFEFITNGNLVTKNLDLLAKIQSQIDTVEISFDAATANTYTVVRGGKFQSVIDAVNALAQLKITVQSQYITQYANYHEILDYCNLANELKINHISLNTISRWPHMTESWWQANKLIDNPAIDYDLLVCTLEHIHQNNLGSLNNVLLNLIKDYRARSAVN